MESNKTHFIACGGLHGCICSHSYAHESYTEAIESLISMYDLSKKRANELRKYGYLELRPHFDGNDYIEINECDCNNPEDHND